MSSKYQVSIVVCSYNPVWEKLKTTLLRAIEQKGINFEIVICDDGSDADYFDKIRQLFDEKKFEHYKLVKNEKNVGTVNNFYGAIMKAQGKYIYGSSPGDYLYADITLAQWYAFAEKKHAAICFGNGVYYIPGDRVELVHDRQNDPPNVECFSEDIDADRQALAFYCGNAILGSTFIRTREISLKYIGEIIGICKYVEDNTSMRFYFADGNTVLHYDNYVVWYEYGTGISTGCISLWGERLKNDFDNADILFRSKFPDDRVTKFCDVLMKPTNRVLKLLKLCLVSPYLLYRYLRIRSSKKRMVNEAPVDMSKFPKFDEE